MAFNTILLEYKKNARNKKLDFSINRKEFEYIINSNCFYCGSPPLNVRQTYNNKWRYTFNGIDRVDNSLGYIKNNCRTCCKKCNYMKREYDEATFLQQIDKIYSFNFKS